MLAILVAALTASRPRNKALRCAASTMNSMAGGEHAETAMQNEASADRRRMRFLWDGIVLLLRFARFSIVMLEIE